MLNCCYRVLKFSRKYLSRREENATNAMKLMHLPYLTGIGCLVLCYAVGASATDCKARNLTATVDDVMRLYIDGVEITYLTNARNWRTPDTVELPCNATLIGIQGIDYMLYGGILASTDDGYIITNSSWKCTNIYFTGWQTIDFDDSDWPPAFGYVGLHEENPGLFSSGLRRDARWIWTTAFVNGDPMVFCRKTLGITPKQIDVDECILDPPDNECDPSMGKCNNFYRSYNCSCYKGYVNAGSRRCEDIDECAFDDPINKCGSATGNCVNFPGSYKCSCHQGYKNINAQTCGDIDECLLGPPENQCNARSGQCINTPPSYECRCYQGFTNVGDQRCEASKGNDSTSSLIILGVLLGVFVLVSVVLLSALLIPRSRKKTMRDEGQSGEASKAYDNGSF